MATEKILNTRIVLTHDDYANLKTKHLKDGEVVLAKVGEITEGNVTQPVFMMKVGTAETTKTVAELPWLMAPAADVYAWAKKENLDPNDLPEIPGAKLGINVTSDGTGNAVTGYNWDATTKTLTLTKGETFATAAELKAHADDADAHKDTTYSAGTKLDLEGTTFNHEATTRTDGADATETAEFGGKITVLSSVASDATGHITGVNTKEITLPTPEEVALPTVADTEVEGQVVVEVDQTEGAIAVTRKAVEIVHKDGNIYLTIGGTKIGEGFSDADFVKDGFLSKVEKNVDENTIIFTWNTDSGVTETTIDIDDLVEVYTGGDGIEVENFVISHAKPATVASNVTKTDRTYISGIEFDEFGHVTKVETGTEEDQDLTHDHDNQYKKIQTAVEDPAADGKSLTFIDSISQDAQGVITPTKKSVNLDNYALKEELPTDFGVTKITSNDTTTGTDSNVSGLKVTPVEGTGEVNIEIDDTIVFILDGGTAADLD